MTIDVTTVSESGFSSVTNTDSYTIDIDPTGEEAPDTLESLLGTYAACYIPALRVGAEQRDVGDLGEVSISVTGELNDDGKLAAVSFSVQVESQLDEDQSAAVIERANSLCKVHDALKSDLHANVSIQT